jgi:hypothetical protein
VTAGHLRAAAVFVALLAAGCGDAGEPSGAESSPPSTARARAEEASPDPGEDAYCEAIEDVVRMPVDQIRRDRASYRAGVDAVVRASPPIHAEGWEAVLAFVEDNTSERLNVAADALERIGTEIDDRCSVSVGLDDWDVLRDVPVGS